MNVSTKRVNPFISWCVFHLQYLLVAVCAIMTIAEILFFPSAGVMTFFLVCVHVLAVVLMPRRPIICCNIIFLTFAICCLIPDDGGPSFLWGTWLALGYVGLRIESLWGMFYPSAVALVRIWRFDADGGSRFKCWCRRRRRHRLVLIICSCRGLERGADDLVGALPRLVADLDVFARAWFQGGCHVVRAHEPVPGPGLVHVDEHGADQSDQGLA